MPLRCSLLDFHRPRLKCMASIADHLFVDADFVWCKAPGCIHLRNRSSSCAPPGVCTCASHQPATLCMLSQGYLFPSKLFSFDTCKYTKPCCFCQEVHLYSFTTYCNKAFLFTTSPFTLRKNPAARNSPCNALPILGT